MVNISKGLIQLISGGRDPLEPKRLRYHWLVALSIGTALTAIFYFSLPWLIKQLIMLNLGTDGAFGIFGALVGALWATLLNWASSVDLQMRQFQAQSLINKSVEVYRPLYDSLKHLRESIDSQRYRNKYPSGFNLIEKLSKHGS